MTDDNRKQEKVEQVKPKDDIFAFERVVKHGLTAQQHGILAQKYKSCLASVYKVNDPLRFEGIVNACYNLNQYVFSRASALPPFLNFSPERFAEQAFANSVLNPLTAKKSESEIKKLHKKDLKDEKKLGKLGKKDKKDDKKNKKKDKKGKKYKDKDEKKMSKKEKKKLKKEAKKEKKGKKGKKDKKKDKKDKKGKKGKKDKKDKKGKSEKKLKKAAKKEQKKLAKQEKKQQKEAKKSELAYLSISDQFPKFSLIADFLSRADNSISRYLPCLALTEPLLADATPEVQAEYKTLKTAAELQFRSEECWRSYLSQVQPCRYSKDPYACVRSFEEFEVNCSLYGLEANNLVQQILAKE